MIYNYIIRNIKIVYIIDIKYIVINIKIYNCIINIKYIIDMNNIYYKYKNCIYIHIYKHLMSTIKVSKERLAIISNKVEVFFLERVISQE